MTTRTLKGHKHMQAKVVTLDNGDMKLISYTTHVAGVENGWLYCNGLYSMTTRKHLGLFAREVNPVFDYQLLKTLYEHNYKLNINTGEVVKRG